MCVGGLDGRRVLGLYARTDFDTLEYSVNKVNMQTEKLMSNCTVVFQVTLARKLRRDLCDLRVKLPRVYHTRWRLHTVPFFVAERQTGKLQLSIFKFFCLTRPGIQYRFSSDAKKVLSFEKVQFSVLSVAFLLGHCCVACVTQLFNFFQLIPKLNPKMTTKLSPSKSFDGRKQVFRQKMVKFIGFNRSPLI